MEIKATFIGGSGQTIEVISTPIESELDFKDKKVSGARAFCFYKDKFVIVFAKDHWNPPGGGVELGEEIRDAVRREVKEETNTKVIRQRFMFLQTFLETGKDPMYQTLSVCIVEPYGEFVTDPDGDITKIKLIDPKEYKQYFDWGDRGDKLMERALEIKAQINLELNYIL